jgi:hypothetical protein
MANNDMVVTNEKIDEFRAAVADLKLRTGGQRSDAVRQVIGIILMVGGFVAVLLDYENSLSQGNALNLASEQILALAMVGVIVIGAALFVSSSIARFLRIWMLRQLYEGQAQVEHLVESITGSGRL